MAANAVLAIMLFYLIPYFEIEPRRNLFIIAFFSTIFIFIWRYVFNHLIVQTAASRVLFFGINNDAIELSDYLSKNPQLGQRPVGFVSLNENDNVPSLPLPVFAPQVKLAHIIQEFSIDTIIISREIKENKTLVSMLFEVIPMGIAVLEFPAFYERLTGKIPLSLIGEVWFLENLIGTKKEVYEFFKRLIDVALALLLFIPALAIFPLTVLAIKLESRGSAFFTQRRIGRNGKEFVLIKYRSMVPNAESMSGAKGIGRDPRHTRIGAFLRKTYLDEIPQLINVLRGEMSFVGPRPERPQYVSELTNKIPFYKMRLLVLPGITGWAQTNMENDASVEDTPEKMQYDLYYIKNCTFFLDLLIALRTLFTLVRRQGR